MNEKRKAHAYKRCWSFLGEDSCNTTLLLSMFELFSLAGPRQVMTACTASFTHGANDVANAIGPYATIYQIWQSGALERTKSSVPIWIL